MVFGLLGQRWHSGNRWVGESWLMKDFVGLERHYLQIVGDEDRFVVGVVVAVAVVDDGVVEETPR